MTFVLCPLVLLTTSKVYDVIGKPDIVNGRFHVAWRWLALGNRVSCRKGGSGGANKEIIIIALPISESSYLLLDNLDSFYFGDCC